MSRAGIARRGGLPAKPAIIFRGSINVGSGTQRFRRMSLLTQRRFLFEGSPQSRLTRGKRNLLGTIARVDPF
jgi:hypothetical protein